MKTVLINGRMTELYPGNGFLMNGRSLVYEKYENGTVVIRDTKQKGRIFCYGYDGLRRTLAQYGYALMKGEEQ